MCTFCVKHGDGKRWYRNAANYAVDLESDLRRRGFIVSFVRDFERNRKLVNAGLGALRFMPRPLRARAVARAGEAFQEHHFGQPVPIEECARIFDIATNITRLPCVCRGAARPGSSAESCCIVATVLPNAGLLDECFRDYRGGPYAQGFHQLTRDEAMGYLEKAEQRGLAHTAWTFKTPFIAAICNCDLPSGCMAMRIQLGAGCGSCGRARTWPGSTRSAARDAVCASRGVRSARSAAWARATRWAWIAPPAGAAAPAAPPVPAGRCPWRPGPGASSPPAGDLRTRERQRLAFASNSGKPFFRAARVYQLPESFKVRCWLA